VTWSNDCSLLTIEEFRPLSIYPVKHFRIAFDGSFEMFSVSWVLQSLTLHNSCCCITFEVTPSIIVPDLFAKGYNVVLLAFHIDFAYIIAVKFLRIKLYCSHDFSTRLILILYHYWWILHLGL
jgi:hypothetical protein